PSSPLSLHHALPISQRYHDFADVEKTIAKAKEHGMQVLLDFHYSDIWADPGRQEIPAAWKDIGDIATLTDSVYQYTFRVLSTLRSEEHTSELESREK